jgi:hypothetical protein
MPAPSPRKKSRARKSYAERTRMHDRAGLILVSAIYTKPGVTEDSEGNLLRNWKASELQTYTQVQIVSCLVNRVAVEAAEMLGTIPPSAIKYCVSKGWLAPNPSNTLYRITLKAAIDLDLPMRFKGEFRGRKIPFAPTPAASAKPAKAAKKSRPQATFLPRGPSQ